MSKMSELYQEILDMLDEGYSPKNICRILDCPLTMVYDVNETRDEEYSPFETVNS
jgi:hypothetical protein